MGRWVFTIKEFLTFKEVASFFSCLAAKKRSVTTSDNEAIEVEEIRKETHRLMIRALDSHPLICEDLVLCEMSRKSFTGSSLTNLMLFAPIPCSPSINVTVFGKNGLNEICVRMILTHFECITMHSNVRQRFVMHLRRFPSLINNFV